MKRQGLRITAQKIMDAAAVLFAALLFCFWFFLARPHQQHAEWYRNIEDHITMLADKRPEGVSPSQWAYTIHMTWNLHGNYGGFSYFDHNERARFLMEFDRRLKGRVDLGTIDWIWDEYVKHSTGGRHYSSNYRPTDPDHLREFSKGNYGSFELQEWLERLERLRVRGSEGD
jgi:hypothetical protein